MFLNSGRVESAITKEKPVLAVLMLESTPNLDPITLHPSVLPLIKEFEDVFSLDLPPGLPPKRGIEH